MAVDRLRHRLFELVRFYQAAVLNTAFGFSLYALLVLAGINIYAAQAISHVAGMTFNYFTYSRHVFRDAAPAKRRFIVSYVASYFVSAAVLAGYAQIIRNPYAAGAATALTVSVANYFVLRYLIFRRKAA